MWHSLAEEQTQHFDRICKFWGEDQVKMDVEAHEQQPKQERLRTRWTPILDKIFADIVVEQIQQGNRPNNIFDKKTWTQIREKFNGQTNLTFNNNQLRKHLDVLRTRFHNIQSSLNQNDSMQDGFGFDMWEDIGVPSKIEPTKTKDCPIYDQLCTIFADTGVDGRYAQSSHYEGTDKPAGPNQLGPESANPGPKTPISVQRDGPSPHDMSKSVIDKKRKRPSEPAAGALASSEQNQDLSGKMVQSLLAMMNSSRSRLAKIPRIDERFTISKCIKALDEIQGIEDGLYYAALDLFENPTLREMFLSLQGPYLKFTWLKGKCRSFTPF